MSRSLTFAAMIVAAFSSVAFAQKPKAKAARVPSASSHPKLPTGVRPSVKSEEADLLPSGRSEAPPVPARQVVELSKTLSGSYKCSGSIASLDGSMRQTGARMKVTTALDGHWIVFDVREKADGASYPLELRIARTYSNGERTWQSVATDNRGNLQVTTTEHATEPTAVWTGDTHRDGNAVAVRVHEDRDDAAGTIRLTSEMSGDRGATFRKDYDLSCTKLQ
ncbi:MAG TPA: hypothetical protein VL463_28535 [Kofleriaceae bacterium]|nr:hypothetical protein [Kofleriaceae bacterium]